MMRLINGTLFNGKGVEQSEQEKKVAQAALHNGGNVIDVLTRLQTRL